MADRLCGKAFTYDSRSLAAVVQNVDMQGYLVYLTQFAFLILIHWIEIFQVDSIIHLSVDQLQEPRG